MASPKKHGVIELRLKDGTLVGRLSRDGAPVLTVTTAYRETRGAPEDLERHASFRTNINLKVVPAVDGSGAAIRQLTAREFAEVTHPRGVEVARGRRDRPERRGTAPPPARARRARGVPLAGRLHARLRPRPGGPHVNLLEGRHALVTGAANGIGRAIAERFRRRGRAVSGRRPSSPAPSSASISPTRSGSACSCDASRRRAGRVDVLCSVAGIFEPCLALRADARTPTGACSPSTSTRRSRSRALRALDDGGTRLRPDPLDHLDPRAASARSSRSPTTSRRPGSKARRARSRSSSGRTASSSTRLRRASSTRACRSSTASTSSSPTGSGRSTSSTASCRCGAPREPDEIAAHAAWLCSSDEHVRHRPGLHRRRRPHGHVLMPAILHTGPDGPRPRPLARLLPRPARHGARLRAGEGGRLPGRDRRLSRTRTCAWRISRSRATATRIELFQYLRARARAASRRSRATSGITHVCLLVDDMQCDCTSGCARPGVGFLLRRRCWSTPARTPAATASTCAIPTARSSSSSSTARRRAREAATDKVCVVTGGGAGIGRAIVEELAARGRAAGDPRARHGEAAEALRGGAARARDRRARLRLRRLRPRGGRGRRGARRGRARPVRRARQQRRHRAHGPVARLPRGGVAALDRRHDRPASSSAARRSAASSIERRRGDRQHRLDERRRRRSRCGSPTTRPRRPWCR